MPTHQFEHKPCFLYLCYCFGGPGFESVWPQLFFFSKFWYLATNNFLVFNDVKCEHLTQLSSVSVYPTITCQVSYSVSSWYTNPFSLYCHITAVNNWKEKKKKSDLTFITLNKSVVFSLFKWTSAPKMAAWLIPL